MTLLSAVKFSPNVVTQTYKFTYTAFDFTQNASLGPAVLWLNAISPGQVYSIKLIRSKPN